MTAEVPLSSDIAPSSWSPNRDRARMVQLIVKIITGAFAAISILTTMGIIATLIFETITFFQELGSYEGSPHWTFSQTPNGPPCSPVKNLAFLY